MLAKRSLLRLQRIRELEEEQSRAALLAAVSEHARLARAVETAVQRQVDGRRRFLEAALEGSGPGCVGAGFEIDQAFRSQEQIGLRMRIFEGEVERRKDDFELRRMTRRQVETLRKNASLLAEAEAGRRAQQMLDDWFGQRARRAFLRGGSRNRMPLPVEDRDTGGSGVEAPNPLSSR